MRIGLSFNKPIKQPDSSECLGISPAGDSSVYDTGVECQGMVSSLSMGRGQENFGSMDGAVMQLCGT